MFVWMDGAMWVLESIPVRKSWEVPPAPPGPHILTAQFCSADHFKAQLRRIIISQYYIILLFAWGTPISSTWFHTVMLNFVRSFTPPSPEHLASTLNSTKRRTRAWARTLCNFLCCNDTGKKIIMSLWVFSTLFCWEDEFHSEQTLSWCFPGGFIYES